MGCDIGGARRICQSRSFHRFRASLGLAPSGHEVITNQQYKRLMSDYKKTDNLSDGAMKADVDRHTAHGRELLVVLTRG